jgi:hypothetical protein
MVDFLEAVWPEEAEADKGWLNPELIAATARTATRGRRSMTLLNWSSTKGIDG